MSDQFSASPSNDVWRCSLSCNLYVVLYPIIHAKDYLKYEKVNKI